MFAVKGAKTNFNSRTRTAEGGLKHGWYGSSLAILATMYPLSKNNNTPTCCTTRAAGAPRTLLRAPQPDPYLFSARCTKRLRWFSSVFGGGLAITTVSGRFAENCSAPTASFLKPPRKTQTWFSSSPVNPLSGRGYGLLKPALHGNGERVSPHSSRTSSLRPFRKRCSKS